MFLLLSKIANIIDARALVRCSRPLPSFFPLPPFFFFFICREAYNTTTYNSFLHLLAMKAAMGLADVVGDAATGAAASAAFTRGQGAIDTLLWNSTLQYLRAYTGGDAVMTDALYGQEIALHHGLGWHYDQGKMGTHLAAELKYNGNAFGLTTVTGRHKPPPESDVAALHPATKKRLDAVRQSIKHLREGIDTEDDTLWLQSGPTWSVMSLRLAKAAGTAFAPLTPEQITDALEPTRKQLENYRTRLADRE